MTRDEQTATGMGRPAAGHRSTSQGDQVVTGVSVVMPCFNHGRFLPQAVASVLGQTLEPVELIIVDDCSTDNSREVIRGLAAKHKRIYPILHERNRGAARSRNDGVRAATGDFICFCDADDLWMAGKLSAQVEQLQQNPAYDVAYSDADIIDETGASVGRRFSDLFRPPNRASGNLFDELCLRNFINMQTVMIRRAGLGRGELFDDGIKWVEDWWCWIRLSRQHRFLYSPDALASYRVHSRSTNLVQQRGYCVNRFKVFKRSLREYPDLSRPARAKISYKMGVELCQLGKRDLGTRLYWAAIGLSFGDVRSVWTGCKAVRRLLMPGRSMTGIARGSGPMRDRKLPDR